MRFKREIFNRQYRNPSTRHPLMDSVESNSWPYGGGQLSANPSSANPSRANPSIANQPSFNRPMLRAKWAMVDGRLTCQWETTH